MIKYTYKKRELNIPEGLGNINNGGCSECILEAKSVQQDSEAATYLPSNGYNGIGRITVDAGRYGQSKWNEGIAYAKNQMVESAFTDNGVYERANGWKKITINVSGGTDPEVIEQAYESGITKGMADQKALLVSTAITANGTYTKEDGYNSVSVNVPSNPQDLERAYNSGMTYQKSLLSAITITENGTYSRENGYSAVTVNVPAATYRKFMARWIMKCQTQCTFNSDMVMPAYLEITHRQMRTKQEALNMVFISGGTYKMYVEYNVPEGWTTGIEMYLPIRGTFSVEGLEYICINCDGPVFGTDSCFHNCSEVRIEGNPTHLYEGFFDTSNDITYFDNVIEWPASVEFVAKKAFSLVPTMARGPINRIFSHSSTLVIEDNPEWASLSGVFECPRGFDYTDVLEALGSGWTANPVL